MILAADPLFNNGVDGDVVLIVIGKTLVVFALLLVLVLLYIWFLRKVIADMQNRIGPERAGPFGVLQSLADGIKLFFKEQSVPDQADSFVFKLAPYLSAIPAFLAFSIVPIGGEVSIAGHQTYLQLADPEIGVLFLLAMSGIGLYGVMLAGWSSGSKYPLLGSVRASAQLISYEAAFGLAIVGVLLYSNTLSTRGIVNGQAWTSWDSFVTQWYWAPAIVAFVIFLIAAIAETNHPPFDLVEAEQELVGGFHTEYTGIRFGIFFLAEFMNLITMSAIAVTLFLGGPSGPALGFLPASGTVNVWIMPVFWFFLKLVILLYGTVWVRAVAAPPAVRPAHGPRMEVAHRARVPLGHGVRGDHRRPRRALGPAHRRPGRGPRRDRRARVPPALHAEARRDHGRGLLMGRFSGFGVTIRQVFKKPVTTRYPKEKRPKPERFHGRHVLNRYDDGMEKCIGCELCAGVCPARCIYVRGADNPPDAPVSPGERYGFVYEINYLRCIHCDLCVEACPTEAITETKLFEFSFANRADAIYTKNELLVDDAGRAKRQPWELWLGGEDDETSAWMRATSPSGLGRVRGPDRLVERARVRLPPARAGSAPEEESDT